MPLIFLKYILPVIIIIGLQIYLSMKNSKILGIILPVISLVITIILALNAFETLGTVFAILIMSIPNTITIGIYILAQKFKKKQDEKIIKLKFENKKWWYMNQTIKGIIITETDFSEADKYITLLTYEHGKISILCKGVRRKNSTLSNKTRLFTFAQFEVFFNRDRYILNDVIIIERFFEITQNIEHFAICSYFVQLCSKLCDEDHVNTNVTRTLISSLYAITKQKKPEKLVKSAIELRLMSYAGYLPEIDKCNICKKSENISGAVFDVLNGGICCKECKNRINLEQTYPLTQGVLQAINHILSCKLDKLYSFNLGSEGFELLYNICEKYVIVQTDYNFKTLEFYKSIGG